VKFKSPIVSEASGSIAGITFSHNRGGMYTRQRVIPTNPGSPYQTAIRQYVAQLSNLWLNTLTAAQRRAWDTYAENVLIADTLGELRNIGGLGQYIRSNVPRLQAAEPRVDDGPTIFNLGDFTEPTWDNVSAGGGTGDLSFDNADAWANEDDAAMLILVSRGQNPSINYFKGPYRYAGEVQGDSVTPPTSPASIALPFAVALGQNVFAQIRVTRADGRLSLPFRAGSVAVA
jgi:hypothetical protein